MKTQVRKLVDTDWQIYRDVRLRSLQESPDAFGSTWEREHAMADDHWRQRLASDELSLLLGLFADAALVGLAAGRIQPDSPHRVDIYQMWVAPEYRGQGGSRLLLDRVLSWALEQGARRAHLQVSQGNEAAIGLYRSAGFQDAGAPEPLREGSEVLSQPMFRTLESEP